MWSSNFRCTMLVAMSAAFFSGCHSLDYSDLEALGEVNCPERDKCQGYRNHLTYIDRSCECDLNCTAYKDCCIDALPSQQEQASRPPPRTNVRCLHYGVEKYTGVYAISKCSSDWSGPRKIRQVCHGRDNFSDPLAAAPVTDVVRKETYRNLACAECNNANMTSLQSHQLKLTCAGLSELSEEQIMGDLTYNQELELWGVSRLNRFGNATEFIGCDIHFDVPGYLNDSVRFCRSNLISRCASDWTRTSVARLCALYTTAVYSNTAGYRNPHCAICNHLTVDQVSCGTGVDERRRRPWSFELLLDVNRSDGGEEVGKKPAATPECPSGKKYDPFFKSCRELVCALPGYVMVNDRCVPQ